MIIEEKIMSDREFVIPIVLAGIDPCFSCTDRMAFFDEGKDKSWSWTDRDLRKYAVDYNKGRF